MPPKKKGKANLRTAEDVKAVKEQLAKVLEVPYTASGVLTSLPLARDIKLEQFSVSIGSRALVVDADLELNWGRRYGLIGSNGTGKSTMLKCIGSRLVPLPKHLDIYCVDSEEPPSDKTPLECVLETLDTERERLEKEADRIADLEDGGDSEALSDIYEQLDELDVDSAPAKAAKILHGLDFTHEAMTLKKAKDFSGGWRMRIALARALFISPSMLLLDGPSAHLSLEAVVWLENYLRSYKRILVVISHSQDFLNNVCTNIIHLNNGKLRYYGGNYDQYAITRSQLEENQMKVFKREQEQIRVAKEFIQRFGSGSNASLAKSKEKTIQRLEDRGLTEKVVEDKGIRLSFQSCGPLPPPVLTVNDVSFGYENGPLLYKNLDFGLDLDSRVTLVGANGAGKSTLLKLLVGKLAPRGGIIQAHHHLKIGYYNQHLSDTLDEDLSPLEYMIKEFDEEPSVMRQALGRFGISGHFQTVPIKILSAGLKSRVVFSWLAYKAPHILMFDEPTNTLDMETIDSLADAINEFEGGLLIVSHDFRLISQVAREIWVCDNQTITKWKGTIQEYKQSLIDKVKADELEFEKTLNK